MVIVRIQGGLGNQMFQYALYRKIQCLLSKVRVDTSWYSNNTVESKRQLELTLFPVKLHECNVYQKWLKHNIFMITVSKRLGFHKILYRESTQGVYLPEILKMRHVFLDGYWQSEKYFLDIRDELLNDFKFPNSITEQEEKIFMQIKQENSVSIHVRRGDYLNHLDKYGNICTDEYYHEAIKYMRKKLTSAKFYIFSDDIKWTKQFFKPYKDIFFVELDDKISGIHDMKLMANCRHNIIANSSFSWWASWLNQNPEKLVIAPKRWQNGSSCSDIRCKNWITL